MTPELSRRTAIKMLGLTLLSPWLSGCLPHTSNVAPPLEVTPRPDNPTKTPLPTTDIPKSTPTEFPRPNEEEIRNWFVIDGSIETYPVDQTLYERHADMFAVAMVHGNTHVVAIHSEAGWTTNIPKVDDSIDSANPAVTQAIRELSKTGYGLGVTLRLNEQGLYGEINEGSFLFTNSQNETIAIPKTTPKEFKAELHPSLRGWVAWQEISMDDSDIPAPGLQCVLPAEISGDGFLTYIRKIIDSQGDHYLLDKNKKGIFHSPNVIITMDDDYWPEYVNQILDIAREHGWRLTFYPNTNYLSAPEQADTMRRILQNGHEIGYHTSNHAHRAWQANWTAYGNHTQESITWLNNDLSALETKLKTITGIDTVVIRTIRAPYGDEDTDWIIFAATSGLTSINWLFDAKDEPENAVERIRRSLAEGRGANILLHSRLEYIAWIQNNMGMLDTLHAENVPFIPAIDSELSGGTTVQVLGLPA